LVDELESISVQFNRLIVKSALAIKDQRKILVTTDSELMEKLGTLGKYGIEGLLPELAESLLSSS
jgi:hypothetical protein